MLEGEVMVPVAVVPVVGVGVGVAIPSTWKNSFMWALG
jgi:uncharacterized protein (DUF697 family)